MQLYTIDSILSYRFDTWLWILRHHGQPVDDEEPAYSLKQFVNFVRQYLKSVMYVLYFPKVHVAVCMKQLPLSTAPKLKFTRASCKQMCRGHFKTNTVPENYVGAKVAFFTHLRCIFRNIQVCHIINHCLKSLKSILLIMYRFLTCHVRYSP